jgi:hypothetical protein
VFRFGLVVNGRDIVIQVLQLRDLESTLLESAGSTVDAQAFENLDKLLNVFRPASRVHADIVHVMHTALLH